MLKSLFTWLDPALTLNLDYFKANFLLCACGRSLHESVSACARRHDCGYASMQDCADAIIARALGFTGAVEFRRPRASILLLFNFVSEAGSEPACCRLCFVSEQLSVFVSFCCSSS